MNIGIVILLIIMYLTETIKYYVGLKACFNIEIERIWITIAGMTACALATFSIAEDSLDIYFIMIICVSISVLLTIKGSLGIRFSRTLMVLVINACLDEISGIPVSYFVSDNEILSYYMKTFIESLITICIFCLFFIVRKKGKWDYSKFLIFIRKKIILVVIAMFCCLSLTIEALVYERRYVTDERLRMFSDIIGIIAFICIVLLIVFIIYIRNVNEKMQDLIETERDLQKMQDKYYIALLAKEEDTRRYRHDMNNHLICLKELAQTGTAQSTLNYIQNLQDKLVSIQTKNYSVGNNILDVLLNYHLGQAKDVNVKITGRCRSDINIRDVDMCTIFSNLLQNAVEETARQKSSKKYIFVSIKQGQNYFQTEILNSSDSICPDSGKIHMRTKKADKSNHGFGLKNITETVKRNHGDFEIVREENRYRAIVTLKV